MIASSSVACRRVLPQREGNQRGRVTSGSLHRRETLNLPNLYRIRIAELHEAPREEPDGYASLEALCGLIDRPTLTPDPVAPDGPRIELQGSLATILELASGSLSPNESSDGPGARCESARHTMPERPLLARYHPAGLPGVRLIVVGLTTSCIGGGLTRTA